MQPIRLVAVILVFLGSGAVIRAAEGMLQYPVSVAVSQQGDVFIADRDFHGVWRLRGDNLDVVFQGAKNFRTPLNAIRCLAFDRDGKLLAGDSATREIYRLNDQGALVGLTHKSPPPSEARPDNKSASPKPQALFGKIGNPLDIAVAPSGELYVSDLELHRIVKVPSAGGEPAQFASITAPRGICFDGSGSLWVISGRQLVKISPAGETTTVVADGVFNFPNTVAAGTDGTAFVCDGYAKTIWKVAPGGKPEKWVSGAPLMSPVGMRLVADKLFVADPHAKAVFQITSDGKISTLVSSANPK